MRLLRQPSSASARSIPTTLAALVLSASLAVASPFPRDGLRDLGFGFLLPRACESYCGASNELCCSAGQECGTVAGTPTCGPAAVAARDYIPHTTTWTETRTYTSTWSSFVPAPTTAAAGGVGGGNCIPEPGSYQIACGPICCAKWQYCAYDGQCMPNQGEGSWTMGTTTGVGVVTTTQYSAPYRVTSGTTIFSTATGTADSATASPTGTGAAVTTTDNELSGGAIAGIVIGTIAGVILLLLLCFCCIVRGLWHTCLGIFGLGGGKKDRKEERIEVIEERYSRHGGSAYGAARPSHKGWFGGGGRPSTVASRKEKKSDSSPGWLAAAGGAALMLLGLRRGDKKKETTTVRRHSHSHSHSRPPRSDMGSSYFTESYTASSPSSFSTERRRSRHSRGPRPSHSRASRHTRRS